MKLSLRCWGFRFGPIQRLTVVMRRLVNVFRRNVISSASWVLWHVIYTNFCGVSCRADERSDPLIEIFIAHWNLDKTTTCRLRRKILRRLVIHLFEPTVMVGGQITQQSRKKFIEFARYENCEWPCLLVAICVCRLHSNAIWLYASLKIAILVRRKWIE